MLLCCNSINVLPRALLDSLVLSKVPKSQTWVSKGEGTGEVKVKVKK